MCQPSQPASPDYRGAAQETAAGNLDAARFATVANRPNEYTPLGSRTWRNTMDGGNPDQWTSQINLSPEGQSLFDQQLRISQNLGNTGEAGLNRVGDAMAQPFDTRSLPGRVDNVNAPGIRFESGYNQPIQFGLGDAGPLQRSMGATGEIQSGLDYSGAPVMPEASEGARNAVVQALMARQQPGMDQRREAEQNKLITQGHTRGGSAWNATQNDLARSENDARFAAELAGGSEQSRLFNMGLWARQQGVGEINNQGAFANAAQNQGFNQEAQRMGLFNAAQGQAFNQNLAGGQFANQAQQQGQNQAAQNFGLYNAAQGQAFNQGLSNAGLANTGRQNALQEQAFLRQLPLNELNALRSGSQVGMPSFQSYSQQQATPGANFLGAAQAQAGYDQNVYNQGVGQNNSMMSGLFGLGGSLLGGPMGGMAGSAIGGLFK